MRAPLRCPQSTIDAFLDKSRPWLDKQWKKVKSLYDIDDTKILLRGKSLKVRTIESRQEDIQITTENINIFTNIPGHDDYVDKTVEKFLLTYAKDYLNKRAQFLYSEYSDHLKGKAIAGGLSVRVRKMKSRWGSLTRKRKKPKSLQPLEKLLSLPRSLTSDESKYEYAMSLNSKLVQAPDHLIDYVILHELSHVVHMNHSSRFYKLLEELCPQHREFKHELESKSLLYLR